MGKYVCVCLGLQGTLLSWGVHGQQCHSDYLPAFTSLGSADKGGEDGGCVGGDRFYRVVATEFLGG